MHTICNWEINRSTYLYQYLVIIYKCVKPVVFCMVCGDIDIWYIKIVLYYTVFHEISDQGEYQHRLWNKNCFGWNPENIIDLTLRCSTCSSHALFWYFVIIHDKITVWNFNEKIAWCIMYWCIFIRKMHDWAWLAFDNHVLLSQTIHQFLNWTGSWNEGKINK